ncbi:hypothetical protein LDENG_00120530 [Lucifuga dentata]|nr:hypothetical protein LDENG_00120530 [Lucifuga dentata]
MVRERVQKKSFQQSLDDIKERMKEKRHKRLASASAPKGRSRINNKHSGSVSNHTILVGVQQNNKALAIALQAEKEKVRQANAMMLQLKREQQALFLHLLLLKRKLKNQEALAESESSKTLVEPQNHMDSPRRIQISQNSEKPIIHEVSATCTDPQSPEKLGQPEVDLQVTLPPTVGVRRRYIDRSSRKRSECVQEQRSLSEDDPFVRLEAEGVPGGLESLPASPIHSDSGNQNQARQEEEPESADPAGSEEFHHSTPEPALPQTTNQEPTYRKQAQQQPRTKPEASVRGCKPERAPLKKPWENPKPRARSKSRDRSATRAKTAPPPQGNKLSTSLGLNDTFDFECEEAVHLTPFRAKAESNQESTPVCEGMSQRAHASTKAQTQSLSKENESSSSSSPSESEDSLYIPQRVRRRQSSPNRNKMVTTRRGRSSTVIKQKENIPLQQKIPIFTDKESSPKGPECETEAHQQQLDCIFSNSPDPVSLGQEKHQEPHREEIQRDCLLSIGPRVESEMMMIDDVLSSFGESTNEASLNLSTPQRIKTCKKRGLGVRTAGRGLSLCDVTNLSPAAYRKFSRGGSRPSEAQCSTPVPARKRRCTMSVDYKEPSLNAKLRRGDKFTDLQFLRSPIFKQKSDRKSMKESRKSMQPFDKYNESFVGCR